MQRIGAFLSGQASTERSSNDKRTERGELMKYFLNRLNAARVGDGLPPLTMGRMARLFVGIPTKDLYYLKTICDQALNFSKKFWWEIKPENHTPEAIAAREKADGKFVRKATAKKTAKPKKEKKLAKGESDRELYGIEKLKPGDLPW